ncbi:hypothetical protein F5X99DRAFT_366277 [Biscogniauxia marginata]|nr:hypothetical protein F5X99DRAFT_366277 [Biscogniauxia marginata]
MWKRLRHSKKAGSEQSSISAASPVEPLDSSIQRLTVGSWKRLEPKQSALSEIPSQLIPPEKSSNHRGKHSQDRRDDPLGLHVLHAPPERSVDIIFIHGLGGTSLRTWCYNRDLEYLWLQRWLPEETGLSTARILTFGYNAHFSTRNKHVSLTIGDFANDLLFRMKYEENGAERLGQVPIIVVAHSMGGLVFKKAFIHGHMNDEFREIVSCIKAVLFLATPHRGTDLADTLNNVLKSSVFGHSSKEYISELARKSPTINELNETFRHYAPKLRVFSFYETLSTNVGPMSFMILEKESSVLGYPQETTKPLISDHHNVCKFSSVDDPNYTSVVGALRSIVADVGSQKIDNGLDADLLRVTALLGLSGPPEEDLATGSAIRMAGTCKNLLTSRELSCWLDANSSHILWVHAPPGSGKSISCSALVEHLLKQGLPCAFFFFKHGARQKMTPSHMLRSLAFQMALRIPSYRRALVGLARSGLQLLGLTAFDLWKRLFASLSSEIRTTETVYWVVDAIDESESSEQVIDLISRLGDLGCRAKALLFSRPLSIISQSFKKAKKHIAVLDMTLPNNCNDIRLVVTEEINCMPSDDDFKTETVEEIIKRSQGNFLWASLILKQIVKCYRKEQVTSIIDGAPEGMDDLYDRMSQTIAALEMQEDRVLARILLSWAMYAKTPLTVEEFHGLYDSKLGSIIDLKHTVGHVCGQFVTIDSYNRITLIHHSAREYLIRPGGFSFSVEPNIAHEELFRKCLMVLCDKKLRNKLYSLKVPHFLPYAATSWAFHLENCPAESDRVLDALIRFFNEASPLSWIQYLAMSGHLSELISASQSVAAFVRRRKGLDTAQSLLYRPSELSLIETWAVNLMRISAKFGSYLSEDPDLIYRCIPALSPTSSPIYQKFSTSSSVYLSVSGLSNSEWDDCLARVSPGTGRAVRLAASTLHLAVGTDNPKGSIALWDTNLFEAQKTLNVGEHIYSIVFNSSSSMLACYGVNQTYVWKVEDWSLLITTQSPCQERALDFKFDEDNVLVVVTDIRRVYRLLVNANQEDPSGWEQLDPSLLEEKVVPGGMFLGTPSSVSLNNDCTQVAVAYRNFPLTVWNLNPPVMVARLKRNPKSGKGPFNSYTGTNRVIWHPSGTHVLGIYGHIFKWSPLDDSYEEAEDETDVVPHEIQCSPNGLVFLTSDGQGSIRIYDFAQMTVIYKLTSEDSINHVCFNPGSTRFYDIRGLYCNIWEPNCLIRLADLASERSDDTTSASFSFWSDTDDAGSSSISFPASDNHADSKPGIMAVATPSNATQLLAYANDVGDIKLYDPTRHNRHVIVHSLFEIGVDSLAWNQDHNQLAYSLLNGAITIMELSANMNTDDVPLTKNVYVEKRSPTERGRAQQLLFSKDGKKLLVNGVRRTQVLSLPTGQMVAEVSIPEGKCSQWGRHHANPDYLICLSIDSIGVFNWALEKQYTISLNLASPTISPQSIDTLFSSHCPDYILIRTMALELNRPLYEFFILPTAGIGNARSLESSTAVEPIALSATVTKSVAHPIGILPNQQFVFLDRHLWVCTTHLQDAEGAVRRHFFIPHDWVTNSDLRLCQLLADGTIICPSKGEVAVIRSDSISEWWQSANTYTEGRVSALIC